MAAHFRTQASKRGKEIRKTSPPRRKLFIVARAATLPPAPGSTRRTWNGHKRTKARRCCHSFLVWLGRRRRRRGGRLDTEKVFHGFDGREGEEDDFGDEVKGLSFG